MVGGTCISEGGERPMMASRATVYVWGRMLVMVKCGKRCGRSEKAV